MLDGIKVVEIANDISGAFAGKLFATYGAEVILIETNFGDKIGNTPDQKNYELNAEILRAYLHSGKKSISIDLELNTELELLKQIILDSDVLIESCTPGKLSSNGIDFSELINIKTQLVICSITPYGQYGRHAHWTATSLTAAASGGEMSLCGEPDLEPLKPVGHQAYYQGGLHAFAAISMALVAVKRSGFGDHIDLSLQEIQNSTLEGAGPAALVRDSEATRSGNTPRATWGIHPTVDGFIGLAGMPRQSFSIYDCIGRPELKNDPFFENAWEPNANDVLFEMIREWTSRHSANEIFDTANKYRTPFTKILSPHELIHSNHLKEIDFWQEVEHPMLGKHLLPAGPIIFDGDRGIQKRAPLVSEDSDSIRNTFSSISEHIEIDKNNNFDSLRMPLDGLRVIDVTQIWAGPYACRYLGDMGADVIKIEGPNFPDSVRGVGGAFNDNQINKSAYFNEYNRNKKSLVIDLKSEVGKKAVLKLITSADVFVENWSSGVAKRLGFDYEKLKKINPSLVYVSMPGFGHEGSDSNRVGYGPGIEQMGGLVWLQGYDSKEPHKSGISYGDPIAGTTAAAAIAIALHRKESLDQGCHIVIPQRDGIVGLIGEYIVAESIGKPLPYREGNNNYQDVPSGVYQTQDSNPRYQTDPDGSILNEIVDTYIAFEINDDTKWISFCSLIGDQNLLTSEFASKAARVSNKEKIEKIIKPWIREKHAEELAEQLQSLGIAASPVLSPLQLKYDKHLKDRLAFMTYKHFETGEQITTRPVWRYKRRPVQDVQPAPRFGEHTEEILNQLVGSTKKDIEKWSSEGIIKTIK
tara:strand:- start:6898 stop:9330 length:2433 start_codon:yes stop_codon:yes gene_type:complete